MKPLSPRERQIVALLAQGHADKQIGAALGVTRNTIRTYMARIFLKANVQTRVQLAVAWATGKLEAKPVVMDLPTKRKRKAAMKSG